MMGLHFDDDVSKSESASKKRAHREVVLSQYPDWRPTIPNEPPFDVSQLILSRLTPQEHRIVHLDATALVERMATRQLTAEQVLLAFAKVAVAAQDLTNCLSEIFIEEGLARAKELDVHLAATGKVVGPLHGLPVSVKDHIMIKGHDTSTGYVAWAGKTVADRDAVFVDILRRSGAVLYVKTANPQSLLSLETQNHIYGRTVHPFNRLLSPGGSSGGEGALIASRGSPMGIGTDIGGSIRVPAALCGLYGMKASVARMPHVGLMGSHDGMDNIVGVLGPLAHSARDLALFARVMLEHKAWDLEAPLLRMPWNDDAAKGKGLPAKLCIAILADDGVVRPHPPLLRELEETRKALIAAGHEVIDWIPLDHQAGWDLIVKLYFLDAGEEYFETLAEGNEEPTASFKWILSHVQGRRPYTVRETWKLNLERERFRQAALMHWNATTARTSTGRPVDAIITPTIATVAPPHDTIRWWGYSSHWNLLDYPGIVFPTGKRVNIADYLHDSEPLPPARNETEKFVHDQWNPKTYDGAPISLQLVGRRHSEENLLAILDVVETARRDYVGSSTVAVTDLRKTTHVAASGPPPIGSLPAYEFSLPPVSVA